MRVGLAQVNMTMGSESSHDGLTMGLLPYSIALLQSYAGEHAAVAPEFAVPIHSRLAVSDAVARLRGVDVAGFSAYVWNVQVSLEIARRLKTESPQTVIVFGGPEVPDHAEAFLRAHPYVDLVCHGEGEATFTRILDVAAERDWGAVPGTSHLDGTRFTTRPRRPRIRLLDEIPSPFLSGAFDALLAANPGGQWVAMWETNRGCPFSCSFCDWGSATASKVYRFGMERLMAEIDWMADHGIGFVLCCDANFGMLKRDLEIAQAVADSKARSGYPISFSVQNTKNAIERGYRVQKLLHQTLGSYGVTISVQSNNPETLRNINRENISSEAFRELQRRFANDGIYTYTDIILGLPGESYDMFADSVSKAIADGQHNHIQFHNCSVLPNAEMGDPAYQARFGMRMVPQAIRSVYAAIDDVPEVDEYLQLVIATDAMAPADWRATKVFAWLVDLLYFDRVLQIPFAWLSAAHGLGARALIEALVAAADDAARHPVLAAVHRRLDAHASAIQRGGPEYLAAPQWAGLLWPADQYALLSLVATETIDAFYAEAGTVLERELSAAGGARDLPALRDALSLNRALLTRPHVDGDQRLVLSRRMWEAYQAMLHHRPPGELTEQLAMYTVDRTSARWPTLDAYCEHLVRCQGKDKRDYLYSIRSARPGRAPGRTPGASSARREPTRNSPTVASA